MFTANLTLKSVIEAFLNGRKSVSILFQLAHNDSHQYTNTPLYHTPLAVE